VKDYYDNEGATWSENYTTRDGKIATNPALLRFNVVKKIIEHFDCDNFFDAGCADGPVLLKLLKMGKTVRGVDFSSVLVEKGRQRLADSGYSPDLCHIGDVTNLDVPDDQFDTVLCLGVLPHICDLELAVSELSRITKPQGIVILSFRNDLFDLFTFNRLTIEFFQQNFLSACPLSKDQRDNVAAQLESLVTNPQLPEHGFTDGANRRFGTLTRINHNPLTIADELASFELKHLITGYYKFHPVPPLLADSISNYREVGARMDEQYAFSWIGMFMCSTFVSAFRKNG
jgi:ubiquinone/menaquinone biosynthesis C-methylase UbiE